MEEVNFKRPELKDQALIRSYLTRRRAEAANGLCGCILVVAAL